MKSKISLAFKNCKKENRTALITYTVAGDNTKNNSLKILKAISKHADILELGFPHNTPIADGGQIQESFYKGINYATTYEIYFGNDLLNWILPGPSYWCRTDSRFCR